MILLGVITMTLSTVQMKNQNAFMLRCLTSIIFLLLPLAAAAAANSSSSDGITLLTFKSMISDPSNALSSWSDNTTFHYCQWRGVTCGGRQNPDRVTGLNLDSLGLTAPSLPPHIANLTFLTTLLIPNNSFRGSIPHELGLLPRLTRLNLSMNYLDGEIPASLTDCSSLQFISLRENQLSGEIPRDIGALSELQLLNLGSNNLTGTIPPSIGNMSSLVNLVLYENKLVGSIPESMGKLSSLRGIAVSNNTLSGNIPDSFYNLSSLGIMSLEYNLFTGTLPPDLFDVLPNLQALHLYGNQLEGRFPSSLSNATNLQELQLALNNFSGTIPSNLGNLPYLTFMGLDVNHFEAKEARDWDFLTGLANSSYLQTLTMELNNLGGMFPVAATNLSSTLLHLSMGRNHIAGSIPQEIGNLGNLTVLGLNDNLLAGHIPATIGKLQQLLALGLKGNRFTGQIPHTFGNLTQLNLVYLQGNRLNGSIPATLGNCRNLQELDISQNMLTGAIPKEIFMLSSLSTYLDLSNNLLTGPLPLEVGILTNLNSLGISDNKLSGEIPKTLGNCKSLEYLFMEQNLFNGAIPRSMSELKGLRQLDLSQNNLSGDFPMYIGSLGGLQYLNLSYNGLQGEVPDEGIFRNNSTKVSVLGNKNLCGGNLLQHLPACHTQNNKQHKSHMLKVIIPALGASLCLILFLGLFVAHHRLKNQRKKTPDTTLIEGQFRKVSYAELLKATDGFSPSNLIGAGSVGSVYKGILYMDESTNVAVKVLNLQQRGAFKSFMAECDVLKSIRHRNLVKILTACSSVDFSGNDFKALVLELMPNGSLEKWLHPVASDHSGLTTLSFDQRLNIAIDVASALEYLHHQGQRPIVHCDLKPSNILLDAGMCAHVGDFGLARFIWESLPERDEQHTTSVGIKGTIGYVAPEYGMGGQASTYGDVYSYGILLLELFTGKRPTDEMFTDGLNLHNYAETAFPERVMDIVDSRLSLFEKDQGTRDNNQNKNDVRAEEFRCLISVIGIGLSSSKQDPKERLEMEDITKELNDLRDELLKFKLKG